MTTRTCMITGASRGIGAATVRTLSEAAGFETFVLVARPSDDFDAMVSECRSRYPANTYVVVQKDLGRDSDVDAILSTVIGLGKTIDVIINNAGYTNPCGVHEIDADDFRHTMEVNLIAPFRLIQGLLRNGNRFDCIINIASTAGITARAGWLTYGSSKAAMIYMSDVLRQELVVYGTRVVCLSPGRCATSLRRTLAPDEDPATIMQPSHVASVISMMLSSAGSLIDSENIVVRQ